LQGDDVGRGPVGDHFVGALHEPPHRRQGHVEALGEGLGIDRMHGRRLPGGIGLAAFRFIVLIELVVRLEFVQERVRLVRRQGRILGEVPLDPLPRERVAGRELGVRQGEDAVDFVGIESERRGGHGGDLVIYPPVYYVY
jgi:hypothetical protein